MRIVVQRVLEASVSIEGQIYSQIQQGLLILLGIENNDTEEDVKWLSNKIANLRIFSDENGLVFLIGLHEWSLFWILDIKFEFYLFK